MGSNKGYQIEDTTYTVLPQDFTLHVTDHKGRYPFDVKLHPVKRPEWQYRLSLIHILQIDSTTLNYSAADGQVGQSALAYNKIEVPQGGEYTLVLNDGTKVHLNLSLIHI